MGETKSSGQATNLTDPVLALAVYWLRAESCTLWYMIPRMRGLRMRPSTKPSSRPTSPSGYRHSSWWFNELTLDATQVPELSDPRIDTLRLFRNGCFHYQRDYQKFAPFSAGT